MESHHKVSVIRRFSDRTHKEMETISGCQDNFQSDTANNCFAIADGATQSFYSSIWSKLLVDYFCENPQIDKNNWQEWLKPIQGQWLEEVREKLAIAKTCDNTAWIEIHNRLNRFESATSTFIGLQFIENQAKISIVGDSCLFIFKGNQNQLIQTHLLQNSTDFNNRPGYFGSRSKNNDDYEPEFLDIELKYEQHSDKLYFVLATDALAEYIFKYTEQQRDILTTLLKINTEQEFENFVAVARHDDTIKMKNDDVTLMILEVSDCKILSPSIQPIKQNQGDSPVISSSSDGTEQHSKEDKSNPSKVAEEPKDNTSDQKLEDTSGFAKIRSNLQTLLKFLPSLPMMHRNSTGASSSSRQPREDRPPVIKGIDGIRNLLLVFIPLNILSTATILYFISQTANKIDSIKNEQSINSNSSSRVTEYKPKYMNLEKGNKIYKDKTFQEIIIPALSDSSQVLILEEGDKWIKFQIDLYANQEILNECYTCARDEIEIKPKTNLRIFPSGSEGDVFGQLSEPSKFKKLEFDSLPNWSKFTFVGYVKK
jgi:serine/threonine protein phosphatase PrpC